MYMYILVGSALLTDHGALLEAPHVEVSRDHPAQDQPHHLTRQHRYVAALYKTHTHTAVDTYNVHVLMRYEKEERKKQGQTNNKAKQNSTPNLRQSLFLKKMSCLGWDDTLHSRQSALPTELPRQHRWLVHVHVHHTHTYSSRH